MIRIAVTGSMGQVASSLVERAGREFEVVLLGRRVFLLEDRAAVVAGIRSVKPDVVINAAAYTAVDQAEAEESLALAINGEGRAMWRKRPSGSGRRFCNSRPITSSTGRSTAPTARTIRPDRAAPTGARSSPARGSSPSVAKTASSCAPPGSSAPMARISSRPCCRSTRRATRSRSSPTSTAIRPRPSTSRPPSSRSPRVREDASPALRGVFHMTGAGEATWAEFAAAIFAEAAARGRRQTRVKPITTAEYPRPAPRPANSRLDNAKLRQAYGVELPQWRTSLAECCARLIASKESPPSAEGGKR